MKLPIRYLSESVNSKWFLFNRNGCLIEMVFDTKKQQSQNFETVLNRRETDLRVSLAKIQQ